MVYWWDNPKYHSGTADQKICAWAQHCKEVEQECSELRLQVSTLGVQLDAWHSAFGTTQLSHALARLEAAESECAAWRAAAHEGRNGCIETDGEREEGT